MRKELPKQYDPTQVESQIYQMWLDSDCFKAEPDPDKKPYSIVMPPPNVTGQLHMGHALDSTLQDILTRYKRMEGYSALDKNTGLRATPRALSSASSRCRCQTSSPTAECALPCRSLCPWVSGGRCR